MDRLPQTSALAQPQILCSPVIAPCDPRSRLPCTSASTRDPSPDPYQHRAHWKGLRGLSRFFDALPARPHVYHLNTTAGLALAVLATRHLCIGLMFMDNWTTLTTVCWRSTGPTRSCLWVACWRSTTPRFRASSARSSPRSARYPSDG